MLLAKYTGLRAVDIRGLRLCDIDWHNAELNIVQSKTERPLVLPLPSDAVNAIAEYILNARPKSDSQAVFLTVRTPFRELSRSAPYIILRKCAKRAGFDWKRGDCKGFHGFRRALGANMLDKNVPLQTISEILGHSRSDSTKPYLSIDLNHLRMCALPLAGFECVREELR